MKRYNKENYAVLLCLLLIGALVSCSGSGDGESRTNDDDSIKGASRVVYHADNDIAMTVRSLSDAIHVGEILRDADYNYHGVLTDGQGRALYTDISGNPGVWDVRVADGGTAKISNVELGDLLAEDLTAYILTAMKLGDADMECNNIKDGAGHVCYRFDGGYIDFMVRGEILSSGLEAARMTITVSRENPCE